MRSSRSSPSSRSGAGGSTAFAGATGSIIRPPRPARAIAPLDQAIGTGDGARPRFQLVKLYGAAHAPYQRPIAKPVAGIGARRGRRRRADAKATAFTCDAATGRRDVSRRATCRARAPPSRAGFLFDVPVRFDTDYLEVDLSAFAAGAIPRIPLVEIKP